MLSESNLEKLATYLQHVVKPIVVVGSLDQSPQSAEVAALLEALEKLRPEFISVRRDGLSQRMPSICILSNDARRHLEFCGAPNGKVFASLVLALLWSGGHPPKVAPGTIEKIAAIGKRHDIVVYMSQFCDACTEVMQAFVLTAVVNPNVRVTLIEGSGFMKEVEAMRVESIPLVLSDGVELFRGHQSTDGIVDMLAS